ncbi:7301_t:CDS:1, partial [Entrophospora sp. SA101]
DNNSSSRVFYQAPFGIWLYLDNNRISEEQAENLKLKKMPLSLLPNYFQLIHVLKLESEAENNLEEYLLANLPLDS